jgi:hypothetical protein
MLGIARHDLGRGRGDRDAVDRCRRRAAGASSFQGVDLGTTSTEIYVPASTAIRKFDRPPLAAPLDEIVVRVAPDVSPQATAVAIGRLLERVHAGADDFDLIVPEALLEQSRRTQRLFNIVMGCIAGISLVERRSALQRRKARDQHAGWVDSQVHRINSSEAVHRNRSDGLAQE